MVFKPIVTLLLAAWAAPLAAQWTTLHSQDFEAAMAPWTHSNGQAFPFGWGRQAATIHPGWAPPNPGNWCLWIDSDATGEIGTSDYAISPAIPTTDYCPLRIRWGIGYDDYYNPDVDFCLMQYRVHTGGTWSGWTTGRTYQADAHQTDSIDIISPVDSAQIRFFYTDGDVMPCAWAAIDNVEVSGFFTGVEGQPAEPSRLAVFALLPNYPNPVRARTTFRFVLSRPGPFELRMYAISGQLVGTIWGMGRTGRNSVTWSAEGISDGVYLYRLTTEDGTAARKLVVLR